MFKETSQLGRDFLFQLVLFTIFLYFFGLPAVDEYRRKEVMLVETKKNTDGIPAPAITIALPDQLKEDVFDRCNRSIEACIVASTFNSTNLIDSVLLGYERRMSSPPKVSRVKTSTRFGQADTSP